MADGNHHDVAPGRRKILRSPFLAMAGLFAVILAVAGLSAALGGPAGPLQYALMAIAFVTLWLAALNVVVRGSAGAAWFFGMPESRTPVSLYSRIVLGLWLVLSLLFAAVATANAFGLLRTFSR